MELVYKLGFLFDQKITSAYRETYRGELGRVQADALGYLQEYGPMKPADLARYLHIPRQHASKIAAKLQELGLAQVQDDKADQRSHLIALTDKGHRFVLQHIHESESALSEVLAGLTEQERQRFLQSSSELTSLLQKI